MHGAELRITDEKGHQEVDGAVDPGSGTVADMFPPHFSTSNDG